MGKTHAGGSKEETIGKRSSMREEQKLGKRDCVAVESHDQGEK